MSKKYTAQELDALVSELETQFNLAKTEKAAEEVDDLKKSEMEKCGEMVKEEEKPEDKDKKPEEKKDEDKKDEEKKDDEKKPEEKAAAPFEKSEYSEDDKAEVKKLYTEMSKSERETHYEALKASMAETTAAPAPVEQPLKKSEQEQEIEALKKSNEELQKTVGELIGTLKTKVVKAAPKGKAVTGLTALAKGESVETKPSISREEAKKILGKKAQTPDLAKSDRDLINAFTFGTVGLDKVQHLLK